MADGYGRYGLGLAFGQMLANGFEKYRAMNLDKEKADMVNSTQNKALDIGEREATRKFDWESLVHNKSQSNIEAGNRMNSRKIFAQNEASKLGLDKYIIDPVFDKSGSIVDWSTRKLTPDEIKYNNKSVGQGNGSVKSTVVGTRQNPDGSVTVVMSDATTKIIPAESVPKTNQTQLVERKPFTPWSFNFMGKETQLQPWMGVKEWVNPLKIQDVNFDFKNQGYNRWQGMGLQAGGNVLGFLNNYVAAPTLNGIVDLGMFASQKTREAKEGVKDWFVGMNEEYK